MPLTNTGPPLFFSPSSGGTQHHPGLGEIHLWRISLTVAPPAFATLSPEEITKLEAFRFEKDRNRFLHTHVATRAIIASYLQTDPTLIVFKTNPFGKPSLADVDTTLQFNISYSHEWALLAISNKQAVGVDLEYQKESIDCDGLADSILTKQELQEFTKQEPSARVDYFFHAWSAKESFLKCLGTGLSIDPRDVAITTSEDNEFIQTISAKPSEPHHLKPLPFHPDYSSALCTLKPIQSLHCYAY